MKHKNLLKSILSVMLITLTTVISIFITSCAEEEENKSNTTPSVYKVSVISGEGGTAKTSETELIPGWEVTITATPEETYRFVNWTVGGKEVSKENPYTTAINQNTQFKANFEKDNYTIKVTAGEGGTVKATKEGELLNETEVLNGTKVTLTATPNDGYSFVNWTLNGEEVSTSATYTVTVTNDIEYVANFITHKVTVIAGEGGTAKASKTQAGHNEQVTLTATPSDGYSFVNWTVNGEKVSTTATYTATITSDTEFKANFKALKGVENSHEWIDLGLPSGLKWATCNVGATTPEEYGDYFAWGETEPKDYYYWNTYKWCNGSYDTMTKYCTDSEDGTVDNKTTLELTDDAARVNWGGKWRMPTKAEYDELINRSNCTWTRTTQNGVKGYKVISKKNGNSIFLPGAGYRYDDSLRYAGSYGYYWSSSLGTSGSNYACSVYFDSSYVDWDSYGYRCNGRSVRAVCE